MKISLQILIVLSSVHVILAQDNHWLIKDGMAKTGFNNSQNVYGSSITSICGSNNFFKIQGIIHPYASTSQSLIPRKDFFIIFNNGEFFSSRRLFQGSVWPISSVNGGNAFKVSGANVNNIEYFYLTDIYTESDEPELLKIVPGDTTSLVSVNPISTDTMLFNQDFVSSKNVVLVIPATLFPSNNQNLSLHFDSTVLHPFNMFVQNSSCSFNSITSLQVNSGIISGISKPNNYHYFCFKVADNIPESRINEIVNVRLMNGSNLIDEVKERIVAVHDPNLVKVKCIMKSRSGKGKLRYYGLYRIQFQNHGNATVDSVKFILPMPRIVNIKNTKLFNWYFSGHRSCQYKKDYVRMSKMENNTLVVAFDKGILLPSLDNDTKNLLAKGAAEICVEFNSNPLNKKIQLLPYNASTIFNTSSYPMDFEFDPSSTTNRNKRPLMKDCNCKCLPEKTME